MKESWCVEKFLSCVLCEFLLLCATHIYLKQLPKLFCRFFWYISQAGNCGNIVSLDAGYVPGSFTASHVEVTAYRPCPLTPQICQQLYIERDQTLSTITAATALTHRLESYVLFIPQSASIYINVI